LATAPTSINGQGADLPVMASKVRVPLVALLVRARLNDALDGIWGRRLGLVVAPPGSGKTSLLVQFALSQETPVAWYRAEVSERDAPAFLAHVRAALAAPLGAPPAGSGVEDVIRAVDDFRGRRLLLVIDDLHLLEGSNAERALQRLIDCAPPALSVLAATRRPLRLNLSRLRVSNELLEITADHLRFRTWEVERLFRDFHQKPLPPEELADLTRRTEGWAAGLQLFHLATAAKPPDERRRAVASLGSRRLLRDYLADNVLAGLPGALREFLVGTCVLGRLTAALCDQLLDTTDSRATLEEIELRQIFIHELAEGTYRYHEVLRSYLEGVLVERVGEMQARARYRRAGALLEQAGFLPEALRAFCRGEDWRSADRLLGGRGKQLLGHGTTWIEALPRALVDHDPWLILTTARRELASGRLADAVAAYRRAEVAFRGAGPAEICRRERRFADLWLDPEPAPSGGPDWPDLLRAAVRRSPLTARERAGRLPGPGGRLVEGLASLLAGHGSDTRRLLAEAAGSAGVGAALGAAVRLGAALASQTGGGSSGLAAELERAATDADELGLCWIARIGRAGLALSDRAEGVAEAAAVRQQCAEEGDAWGEACASLLEAIGTIKTGGDPVALLEACAEQLRQLGGGTLEAWSRSLLALAMTRAGHPEAQHAAMQAEAFARSAAVAGARGLAFGVLAVHSDGYARDELLTMSRSIAEDADWIWERLLYQALPELAGSAAEADGGSARPPVQVRCFGGFTMLRSGKAVDLGAVKPRARTALRFLAVNAGRGVHREQLMQALWPDVDPSSATRNLQVAISAVRRCLDPDAPRGASSLLVREGDTYRLRLDDADLDVSTFESALADARIARAEGDLDRSRLALETAMSVYRGDLLPEDGPSEWVVERRERFRVAAADAAAYLAELELRLRPEKAVEACIRGLAIDRYRDDLWRLLAEAHARAGDHAATARVARDYDAVLVELGLPAANGAHR
jgi:DNA-binding SARP family transcriptional activator